MITVPSTKGAVLVVHELGGADPDAPALLLCHATGFHGRVWSAMADLLTERRCLAIDFRGYGDSTEPTDGDLDWLDFGDDVLAVIDALGLDGGTIDGVGHSMGGAALLLAEEARPGTLRRLVCFEPIMFPPSTGAGPASNPLAEVTRHRRESFPSFDEAIERFASKPPLGSLRSDVLADYVRYGFRATEDGVTLRCRREFEARTYELGGSHDGFSRLGDVRCPVLVAAGDDGGHPGQIAPLVAEEIPGATFATFEGLGHFGPLEDPERFAEAVRSFLAG